MKLFYSFSLTPFSTQVFIKVITLKFFLSMCVCHLQQREVHVWWRHHCSHLAPNFCLLHTNWRISRLLPNCFQSKHSILFDAYLDLWLSAAARTPLPLNKLKNGYLSLFYAKALLFLLFPLFQHSITSHCKPNRLDTDSQPTQFSYLLIADQYFVDGKSVFIVMRLKNTDFPIHKK